MQKLIICFAAFALICYFKSRPEQHEFIGRTYSAPKESTWVPMINPHNKIINIEAVNLPLRAVFDTITKQTDLGFFYASEEVWDTSKITIRLKNITIEKALCKIFANSDIYWIYEYDGIKLLGLGKKEINLSQIN